MEKTAKLNGKELRLASSLFTIISYRNIFGTELFDDVEKLEAALKTNRTDVGRFIDVYLDLSTFCISLFITILMIISFKDLIFPFFLMLMSLRN